MTSTLKVNTIQDIGGNTLVSSDGTGGFTNNLPAGKSGAFRNIIINGSMDIAQRGTSATGINTTSNYSTVDRFEMNVNALGTFSQEQSTDVPSGQGFANSMKLDCTTADASPASVDYLIFRQKIEGQNLQYLKKGTANAESVTMSFWVKSNKTGTYICDLYDADNARQISKAYTIDSASTWEKKTLTFAGDTSGAFDNDNARSLDVNFFLGAGSNFTSGTLNTSWGANVNANRAVGQVNLADDTANEWYITGVQLEAGTTASDFEFLPYDVNLQRCQRYYETGDTGAEGGLSNGSGFLGGHVCYNTSKRATATLTQSGQVYSQVFNDDINLGEVGKSTACNDKNGFHHSAINGGAASRYKFTYTADAEL